MAPAWPRFVQRAAWRPSANPAQSGSLLISLPRGLFHHRCKQYREGFLLPASIERCQLRAALLRWPPSCVPILSRASLDRAIESCLMQDEPGGRGCFACKMSLERGSAMLGIDDQSEQQTGNEPGRDPGFFESQRSRAFRRREKGGG